MTPSEAKILRRENLKYLATIRKQGIVLNKKRGKLLLSVVGNILLVSAILANQIYGVIFG